MKWKATALLVLYLAVMMGVFFFGRASSGNTRIQAEGIYGPPEGREEIKGNLTISSPQVTLQNTSITGNLYLSSSKGQGEIKLENVDVTGSLVVMGSGSTLFLVDSTITNFSINSGQGTQKVHAWGNTRIGPARLERGADLEEKNLTAGAAGFTSISVIAAHTTLSGSFETIRLEGKNPEITLQEGFAENVEVAGSAKDVAILRLFPGTRIDSLQINAPAHIRGEGTIVKAMINAEGAVFQQTPQEILLAPQLTAMIAGKEIAGEPHEENQQQEDEEKPVEDEAKRPAAPVNFRATYNVNLKRITLTWQPGDEELTDRYLLTRRQGQGRESLLGGSRSLTYNDTSVSPGQTYTYYLVAVSPDGYFSRQVEVRVSVPEEEQKLFTLEILINPSQGGSVSGAGTYSAGTVVNLTATPAEGFQFSHWENTDTNSTDATITITMTAAKTITAVFREIPADPPPPPNDEDNGPDPEP